MYQRPERQKCPRCGREIFFAFIMNRGRVALDPQAKVYKVSSYKRGVRLSDWEAERVVKSVAVDHADVCSGNKMEGDYIKTLKTQIKHLAAKLEEKRKNLVDKIA